MKKYHRKGCINTCKHHTLSLGSPCSRVEHTIECRRGLLEKIKIESNLEILPKFWELIKDGSKKLEFRKLSKGLISGWHVMLNLHNYKILGYMKIRPIAVNPDIEECDGYTCYVADSHCSLHELSENWIESREPKTISIMTINNGYDIQIDSSSYAFIKENYIDDHHDFVVYEVEEWKECS